MSADGSGGGMDGIERWRAERAAALTAADGWLSVVGLEWLEVGASRIGAAPDNDIVLPGGPDHAGVITLSAEGELHFSAAAGVAAEIDGRPQTAARLLDTSAAPAAPTRVAFGGIDIHVIERDGRRGLRIRDADSAARRDFAGLDYFPVDPSWRIEADWVAVDPPREIEVETVIGTVERRLIRHKAVFVRDGAAFELWPTHGTDHAPMFVLRDRTSGRETYGAGRFLTGGRPEDGRIVLDFNRACNPPCAFTDFATCPLPPPENRLDLAVTAGEKIYRR